MTAKINSGTGPVKSPVSLNHAVKKHSSKRPAKQQKDKVSLSSKALTPGGIKAEAEKLEDWVINLRHDIHRQPELGGEEEKTSRLVAQELKKMGIKVKENVGGYGVVGYLKGGKPGKTVGLRADMDALPINEETGLPFASEIKGKMHACGHDAHTAILLGTAAILSKHRDELAGDVRFFFQPAEEGMGGAERMIAEGAMDNPTPDAVFALHVYPTIPYRQVGLAFAVLGDLF